MTPQQTRLLAESYPKIERRLRELGSLLHWRLLEICPECRHLFKSDMEEQMQKMARVLAEFARGDKRLQHFMPVTGKTGEVIIPGIGSLGARHEIDYHVQPRHYGYMHEALLFAIQRLYAKDYTREIGYAWSDAFRMIAGAMQKQAGDDREAVAYLKLSQRLSNRRSPETNPRLVEWSDALSVYVEQMNNEHKRLVFLLNELYGAVQMGAGQAALGGVLNGLILYASYHFSHEEDLFRRSNYPGYEKHLRQHQAFTATVLEVNAEFQSGASAGLPGQVLEFLKDWLSQHIMGSDRAFGVYVKANPGALRPENASLRRQTRS
jgi:hemerythrin